MTEKRIMPCENVREAHNVNAQMRRELKAKEGQNFDRTHPAGQ